MRARFINRWIRDRGIDSGAVTVTAESAVQLIAAGFRFGALADASTALARIAGDRWGVNFLWRYVLFIFFDSAIAVIAVRRPAVGLSSLFMLSVQQSSTYGRGLWPTKHDQGQVASINLSTCLRERYCGREAMEVHAPPGTRTAKVQQTWPSVAAR